MQETPKKTTADLLAELQNTPSFVRYYQENQTEFRKMSLAEELSGLLKEKNLKKADVVRESEMSDVHVYQIFSGRRKPDRDKLLLILIAMHLPFEDVQNVLKHQDFGQLYAKNDRDCVVIYGICNGLNAIKINDMLFDWNLPILK